MGGKRKFTLEALLELAKSNNVTLLEDYSKFEKITYSTKIKFNCLNENCKKEYHKDFRGIIEHKGFYCKDCLVKENENFYQQNYKFDNNFLLELVNKANATLLEDYNKQKVTSETMIKFICNNDSCKFNYEKMFKVIIDKDVDGFLCNKCLFRKTVQNKKIIKKSTTYTIDALNKLVEEQNVKILEDYKTYEKITGFTIIKFECLNKNCNEKVDKKYNCLKEGGFYCSKCTLINAILKKECIENKNIEVKIYDLQLLNRMVKENDLELTESYENINLNKDIRIKGKCKTEKCEGIFNKIFDNLYNNKVFFCEICSKKEINERKIETYINNYGFDNPLKNPEYAEKHMKSLYNLKKYKMPSGVDIDYQGFENFAFDDLLKKENISEEDLIFKRTEVPELWWIDNENKKHRHYVDIYVKSLNKCIEVKSTFTFEKKKEEVLLKQKFAKENGYLYEIRIYGPKGKLIEKLE